MRTRMSMKMMLWLWLAALAIAALAPWSSYSRGAQDASGAAQQLTEYSFYKQDGAWKRGWFQCDRRTSVGVMLDASNSNPQRFLFFNKSSPAERSIKTLALKTEEDCGMQKCWWAFNATGEGGSSYAVEESHYLDPEGGYWTRSYRIGVAQNEDAAISRAEACRWFPRTRAAVITARRSLYITETARGQLVLRAYGYRTASDRPDLLLVGGASRLDSSGEIETFTFRNRGFTYQLKLGATENRARAEFTISRGGSLVQTEDCLSYTYLKKS